MKKNLITNIILWILVISWFISQAMGYKLSTNVIKLAVSIIILVTMIINFKNSKFIIKYFLCFIPWACILFILIYIGYLSKNKILWINILKVYLVGSIIAGLSFSAYLYYSKQNKTKNY
jgi:hypothetical protein